ncbi:MAG: hypothetical protein KIS77_22485 [Saprospiraceae bacterium]|nr:hypothetical protein [Saprospiraceae bacterium]MCW5925101.1 hypothetical protein [Saprospiraceae bacterium]
MKRLLGGLIIIGVLMAALWLPIEIPFTAESIGRVHPAREWVVLQDRTGRITSIVRDHRIGATHQIDAYQFDQGDIAGLRFDLPPQRFIAAGDTVVRMYSIRQSEEIQQIEAQLALYGAQLQSDTTGEKPPIVEEAERRLHFAEQDLVQKEKIFNIKKPLWEQQLIAFIEYQEAENAYNLARIQVEIARQYLENMRTGIKVEQVGVTQAQLRGLRNRLDILRRKGLAFVLRSPFSGWVVPVNLPPDEQLIVEEAGEYVVQIPVKTEYLPYLNAQATLTVTDVQTQRSYTAQLLYKGNRVEVLDNRQVSVLTAIVKPDSLQTRLSTGVSALCRVDFGKINQRAYLRRILKFKW